MGEHEQVGLVAVASVDAYENNLIKKHEFTRPVKEDDRVNHMVALDAQVGPVFLTYKAHAEVDALVAKVMATDAEYDFEAEDGTRHAFWVVEEVALSADIEAAFFRDQISVCRRWSSPVGGCIACEASTSEAEPRSYGRRIV